MQKQNILNRILSFLLAVLLLCSSAPFPAFSEEIEQGSQNSSATSVQQTFDDIALKITRDGQPISMLFLQSHEKIDICADGVSQKAQYQWQVLHPEKDDLWVNIYDCTEQTISVTLALLENVLREDGTAQLRCRVIVGDCVYQSEPVTVSFYTAVPDTQVQSTRLSTQRNATLLTEGVGGNQKKEFITITVQYLRFDYVKNDAGQLVMSGTGVEAFTPYVATIPYEGDLTNQIVKFPTIVGYESHIDSNGDGEWEKASQLVINQTDVKEDIVIDVRYYPANVKYEVHYFFQNVYDDNYVVDETIGRKVVAKGPTGYIPDDNYVNATFDGFTAMYYQPDIIAADGSTIFEVYFERNYYLMDFDCAGGYGANALYVRYGTYVSVPRPNFTGSEFVHWDMTGAWDKDGVTQDVMLVDGELLPWVSGEGTKIVFNTPSSEDHLPLKMPYFNTSYVATWREVNSQYTYAYWIKDPNGGNKHTFLGSRVVSAQTGGLITITDDYENYKECGFYDLSEAHQHSDACYSCSLSDDPNHTTHHLEHTFSCYDIYKKQEVTDENVQIVISRVNQTGDPDDGIYFYFVTTSFDSKFYYKVYLNGRYYEFQTDSSDSNSYYSTSKDQLKTIFGDRIDWTTEKTAVWYQHQYNNHSYTVYRYKANTPSDSTLCTDVQLTCKLKEHPADHVASCEAEVHKYVNFDEAFSISQNPVLTVAGDGSTVINLYYEYKTYEIRFVYGRDSGPWHVCGGTESGHYATCNWNRWVSAWPEVKDPSGATERTSFTGSDGHTYYYISLTAKFGADLTQIWPANNIGNAPNEYNDSNPNDDYVFGSWGTEAGSPYRVNHAGNANIAGIYPSMSAELIKDDAPVIRTITEGDKQVDVYLAQTMVAWWGETSITPHRFHYYHEVLSLPDGLNGDTISTDVNNPTSFGGESYIKRSYKLANGTMGYKYYLLTNETFKTNHDEWTRVLPVEYAGYDLVNPGNAEGLYAVDAGNVGKCSICHPNNSNTNDDVDYCNVFLFDRSIHKIRFWNVNGYLGSGEGSSVRYEASLKAHGDYFTITVDMDKENYPTVYEKGSRKFDGWYLTPNFVPGTEVDWTNTTMPDADFTVYAKWEFVEHKVSFYFDYDAYVKNEFWVHTDKNGNPVNSALTFQHGTPLPAENYVTPILNNYRFIGWFYLDKNGEKAFAPEGMEIKQDLRLFAEWVHEDGVPTTYEVYYHFDKNNTPNNLDDDVEIANPTMGYSGAGRTKTFQAKGNTELFAGFQEKYFPRVGSHSILMDEMLSNGETPNVYTFQYVYDELVYYKVRYLNVADNSEITSSVIKSTSHAVVTERYLPVENYVPVSGYYYQTRALISDGSVDANAEIPDANVITFYYMEDTEHAPFSIEYYVEDSNGSIKVGTKFYSLRYSFTNTADLIVDGNANVIDSGAGGEFSVLEYEGYQFLNATVTNYNQDGTEKTTVNQATMPIQGTLDDYGLTIKLYYNKVAYAYSIKFVESGTENILGYWDLETNTVVEYVVGQTPPSATEFVGEDYSFTAAPSITIGGNEYNFHLQKPTQCDHDPECASLDACYIKLRTQSKTIRVPVEDNDPSDDVDTSYRNELVFYYVQRQVTVYYKVVCSVSSVKNAGNVSFNSETVKTRDEVSGSLATATFGFDFVGWYDNEACTGTALTTDREITKNDIHDLNTNQDSVTYYALFTPNLTTMTIQQTGGVEQDYFLIHIKGSGKTDYVDMIVSVYGNQKVSLEGLPVGTYTVTLITDWSWKYTCSNVTADNVHGVNDTSIDIGVSGHEITFVTDKDGLDINIITFTVGMNEHVDWLNGETSKEYP